MKIAVIGGGMAGYAAGITAAKEGHTVLVLEKNRKPLKKLGAAGNGRGNLLNRGPLRYPGGEELARQVLERIGLSQVEAFWEEAGVPLREEEEGRVYPASLSAMAAVEGLRQRAERLGVRLMYDTEVLSLHPGEEGFCLETLHRLWEGDILLNSGRVKPGRLRAEIPETEEAERVIVACGGAAAPQYGTDGTAYSLLTGLGHRLTQVKPALCALVTREPLPERWAGLRFRARLRLESPSGEMLRTTRGEILLARDGVSGIAAMELSSQVENGCRLVIDLTESLLGDALGEEIGNLPPKEKGARLVQRLKERRDCLGAMTLEELLRGAALPQTRDMLRVFAGVSLEEPCGEGQLRALAQSICSLTLTLEGNRGFESAQVTSGGLALEDWNPETLESRLVPGLYVCGEVLDVDGVCGGYNLMFAVASGILAGQLGKFRR